MSISFYLLLNSLYGRSALQMLSLKEKYIYIFLIFLIIDWSSSFANCWFSELTPFPLWAAADFL